MGVSGLWKILEPTARKMSFKQLNIQEGLTENGGSTMVVGVDACLWLTQCQKVFHKPNHAQMGRNPELRILFYKLAALNQVGVIAVFVFDGPNRPSVKRNKRVKVNPHWLVEEFREMIELFGFHSYTAPGEAEAELAYLNRRQHIGAVLTDDGDTVVFGAQQVIRTLNVKDKDEVTLYKLQSFESNPTGGLTLGGLLLIVLLNGGDYDTIGLAGCGINIARGLACCGFGDSLLAARQNMARAELEEFLIGWRTQLRKELATNSKGRLPSKQKMLSERFPDTFPSLRVLDLYVFPATSWSEEFLPPATDNWVVKLPSLPELALYCRNKFGWSSLDINGKFKKLMFAGLFMRRLTLPFNHGQQLHSHVVLGRFQEEYPPLSAFLIIQGKYSGAEANKLDTYKVKVLTGGLSQWILSRLGPPSAAGSVSATASYWMPTRLMEHYFPVMVAKFNGVPAAVRSLSCTRLLQYSEQQARYCSPTAASCRSHRPWGR
ncbi:PIN domain-like protein [Mycena belliarum]|uniref:PIN domain-like protein n=1 Tax=Mycena belliarum TaxID=1033014 RepID=A0AAD6XT44_9AGAR|nr:PIN domain-like protein [Mycena belliae]